MAALAAGAVTAESLISLDLACCGLNDAQAVSLVAALAHSKTLTSLCLRSNDLGDEAAAAVATHLLSGALSAPPLAHLDLSDNRIGDLGAGALGHGVKRSVAILELDLSKNTISDDGGAALLLPLQPAGPCGAAPHLARLSLASNACGLRTSVALAAVLRAPGSPLAGAAVDLSFNAPLCGDAASKLESAFADAQTARLSQLTLHGTGETDAHRLHALCARAVTPLSTDAAACAEAATSTGLTRTMMSWVGTVRDPLLLRPAQQAPLGASR